MVNDLATTSIARADALFDKARVLQKQDPFDSKIYSTLEAAAIVYLQYKQWERYLQSRDEMAIWLYRTEQLEEFKEMGMENMTLYEQNIPKETQLKGDLLYTVNLIYFSQNKYEKCFDYIQASLTIYKKFNYQFGIANAYSSLASLYNHTFRNKESLVYRYKSLKIHKTLGEDLSKHKIALIYINIAHSYRSMHQFQNAINYLQRAVFLFTELYGEYSPYIINLKNFLGRIMGILGEYALAIQYLKEALYILEYNQLKNNVTAITLMLMGEVYAKQNNWKKASPYFQRAIQLKKEHQPNDYQWFAFTYSMLSTLYAQNNDYPEAEMYFQKALHASSQLSINRYIMQSDLYLTYIKTLQKQNKLNEILLLIQEVEICIQQAIQKYQVENQLVVLNLLFEKLNLYCQLYDAQKKIKFLQDALQMLPSIYSTIENLRISIFQEKDQLNFNKRMSVFYENALHLLYEHYQSAFDSKVLEEMFKVAEKNKVHSLLSKLNEAFALQFTNIPLYQKKKLQSLQLKITASEKKLQAVLKTQNDSLKDEYAQELVELQIAQQQFIQELEVEYPNYLQLKNQIPSIDIKDLQSGLNPQTALIEYEITSKYFYIFCYTQKELKVKRQPLPVDFKAQLNHFIDDGILGLNQKKYVIAAYQLFQLLLQPIVAQLQKHQIQHLLIVPDAELLELPFEALLTAPTNYKTAYPNYPYLLQQYTVRYHYSMTLWSYQQKQQRKKSKTYREEFMGFAPVYGQGQIEELSNSLLGSTRDVKIGGKSYEALLYSEKEVQDIRASFEEIGKTAQTYLRAAANLAHFKEKLQQFSPKYLHIAAHSILNEKGKEFVGILFSPIDGVVTNHQGKSNYHPPKRTATEANDLNVVLSSNEVAQLQLQSDLVFLSCCKSGVGKFMEGEGMLSINRGFLYAGVSNIVFTLFKIYDAKTPLLTHHFYQSILEENQSYTAALRYAKQQMIEMDIPPKFWSGFLLLGR